MGPKKVSGGKNHPKKAKKFSLAGCCCKVVLRILLFIVAIIGLVAITLHEPVDILVNKFAAAYLDGAAYKAFGMLQFIKYVVACKGDVKGCAYNKVIVPMANSFGYGGEHGGDGYGRASFAGFIESTALSHKAFREIAYNPSMGRFPEYFVLANMTELPKGYIPDEIFPTYLNLATDDKERMARRDLLAEVFIATNQNPHKDVPDWEAPSHVAPTDIMDKNLRVDVIAYNVFKQMFGLTLTPADLEKIRTWLGVMNPIAIGMGKGSPEKALELKAINEHFFELVGKTKIGAEFATRATAQGMDGSKRLKEIVMVLFFAGVGGTSVLLECTLNAIISDKETLVPAWKKNAEAVLLESARLYPPVGGYNPMKATALNVATHKAKSGRQWSTKEGDMLFSITNGAHHDPEVFGGADKSIEYAKKFIVGRENAERIFTWGAEFGDIKKCPTMAGCPEAPRPCPGAMMAFRIVKNSVSWFLPAIKSNDGKEL